MSRKIEILIEELDPRQVVSGYLDPDIIDVNHFDFPTDARAFLLGSIGPRARYLSAAEITARYFRIGLVRDDGHGNRSWASASR